MGSIVTPVLVVRKKILLEDNIASSDDADTRYLSR